MYGRFGCGAASLHAGGLATSFESLGFSNILQLSSEEKVLPDCVGRLCIEALRSWQFSWYEFGIEIAQLASSHNFLNNSILVFVLKNQIAKAVFAKNSDFVDYSV
eukprot:GHVP01056912.1.p2 GENE.GHVP01056912.1~~GHVP01056912.1.p2  ORF type:complete len:105 (+),score=13.24 GHVP01056912.1:395-709(+)